MNILSEFPNEWPKDPKEKKTFSTLMQKRRSEARPHPSFDLTGDGNVSTYEFLLANLFDTDKDGKLDE